MAIAAQIRSIAGLEAEVEIGGVGRTVSLRLMPEVHVGDCVYIHAGYATSVVDYAGALESLSLFEGLIETYPVYELFLSTVDLPSR